MNKTIILNAGHSFTDPGACYHGVKEADEVRKIRDLVVPFLRQHFKVLEVPDDLDLKESIKWVNDVASELNDGLAFSIHLNACGNCGARGAETYFYGTSKSSEKIVFVSNLVCVHHIPSLRCGVMPNFSLLLPTNSKSSIEVS